MALHVLLTPLLLAGAPATVTLPEMIYDHALQRSVVIQSNIQQAQFRPMTMNGTQTFNASGRPWDADND